MKKLLFLLLFPCLARAQSETHNFITYDTTYTVGYANLSYIFHISRPANGDTASRPALIFMGGDGQVGPNIASSLAFGPHYWMSNGWDGGIQLANGRHYPIIITVQPIGPWPQTYELVNMLKVILNTYHIKRNSVHLTGFSMGGMAWTAMVCHQNSPGGEDGMKLITSICALEGVSNQVSAAQQVYQMGNPTSWISFGHWAKKYGGKFFGLEGTADYRGLWQVQHPMNDSAAGSAYTQFENIAGGLHCCWNAMYDPSVTDWTASNPNIQQNTYYPGTLGTYFKGENIFQWMLREGDTALVVGTPVVIAGPDQTITAPQSTVTLSGAATPAPGTTIANYAWSYVTGRSSIITSSGSAVTTVTGLVPGTYVYHLAATSNTGVTASSSITITVNAAIPPPPVLHAKITIDSTVIHSPNSIIRVNTDSSTGIVTSVQWLQQSGPTLAIFTPVVGTNGFVISGLFPGTYQFETVLNDSSGNIDSAIVVVTVKAISCP